MENNYSINKNEITINYLNKEMKISFINDKIVRFFSDYSGYDYSFALANIDVQDVEFKVTKIEDEFIITSKYLIIKVDSEFKVDIYDHEGNVICKDYRKEVKVRKAQNSLLAELEGHAQNEQMSLLKIMCAKEIEKDVPIYGLGDKTNFLNKRGYDFINWNSDLPQTHTENFRSLYKDVPFFIVNSKKPYGIFFDNNFKTYYDLGFSNDDCYFFGANDGNLNYYFIYGDDLKEIVSNYSLLTGRSPLPQLWTLGYHQCRWSYSSSNEAREIIANFRKYHIPIDAIHLDIDYMDGYRVFTINPDNFSDFKEMIEEFKNDNIKVVTIIDPGVKVDEGYKIYDEGVKHNHFAKDSLGNDYVNAVWPGDAMFPNFTAAKTRLWWADNVKFLVDLGVRGIWNDMNEPASFKGPLPDDVVFEGDIKTFTHKEIHNVYGHLMAQATYEGLKKYDNRRPFVISRAAYSGSQKYTTFWTGDNQSIWPHLQLQISQLCNMSLSGFVFCGTDIGGFGGNTHKELLIRWLEASIFSPLFRNHSEIASTHQEPWCFDEETIEIYRKFINIRYEFIPYLYDLFKVHFDKGLPIIRPLVLEYPLDSNTFNLNDEFLVGSNILVAPIISQGATKRLVYLPEGNWVNYFTNEEYKGNNYYIINAEIDELPLFIKKESIIVNYPLKEYTELSDTLVLKIYGETKVEHYQDDGESFNYQNGEYNLYAIEVKDDTLKINLTHEGYTPYKFIKLIYKNNEKTLPFTNGMEVKI